MRKLILTTLCALGLAGNAQAQWEWNNFVGFGFDSRLAENGVTLDEGNVGVLAFSRMFMSAFPDTAHAFNVWPSDKQMVWFRDIGWSTEPYWLEKLIPRGDSQRDGVHMIWAELHTMSSEIVDAIYIASTSVPTVYEPRTNGKIVKIANRGADGYYYLRQLDASAGYETVALNSDGTLRWRTTSQPCGSGATPADLDIDFSPPTHTTATDATVGVAGSCLSAPATPSVFVERFDIATGSHGVPSWVDATPGSELLDFTFASTHELAAVYDTPSGAKELRWIGSPSYPNPPSPVALTDLAQFDGFPATNYGSLLVAGRNGNGEPMIGWVHAGVPGIWPTFPDLASFGPGDWSFAVDFSITGWLAWRVETDGTSTLVRLVGLQPTGAVQWTRTIPGVVPGAKPQVAVASNDWGSGTDGYVLAVDVQHPDGMIGVHVERIATPW